ncbi:hypothetical protein NST17_21190 [Caldifermentibacillus hisashii]|uniref:Uncharacterized protein n=1 Tax=Caldifermentibacillus hisashii TaxID=996558 RepID=A0ABU9K4D1_9BACI
MTERLEEIKEIYRWAIENSIANRIADSDIDWLIEQAERVQELKEQGSLWQILRIINFSFLRAGKIMAE